MEHDGTLSDFAFSFNLRRYSEGLVKNRYIGRTFIMPDQRMRELSVRRKLNAMRSVFNGKNVLLVDDSIVRGTTMTQIVQMCRLAGASKVYLASSAPPVKHPNVYGVDMPSRHEFVAHERDEQGVCDLLHADGLIYQTVEDMLSAGRSMNSQVGTHVEPTGTHLTPLEPTRTHLQPLESTRNRHHINVHLTAYQRETNILPTCTQFTDRALRRELFRCRLRDGRHRRGVPGGRGLHSSTFQLNTSAVCGIGGVIRGCVGVL